jgi:hypothetical protein
MTSSIMRSLCRHRLRPRGFIVTAFFSIALLLPVSVLRAQGIPFLTDDEIRMISNELSGDRAFEHIRVLSQWHRNSGMEGFFKAVDYITKTAKESGLEDVRFIEQPFDGDNYTAISGELRMVEPVDAKLADIGEAAVYLSDGSSDADLTAELVWIGDALNDSLGGLDVAGKIVLTNGSPSWAVRHAVWEKGAVGVVAYPTSESRNPMDVPDQISWTSIPSDPPAGKKGTFAFALSPRKGEILKKILQTDGMQDYLATGKKTKGGKIVLRAKVDTEFGPAPHRTGFVEARIRGTKYHDQQIIVTAHLQEEKSSANDDGSGCANIMEIGRAWMKLIKEGKVQRPLRDVRFWWTDEIYSEYKYFRDNPAEPANFLADLHQDMVGANQAMGSRVQQMIMAPHSITSFLDAVFESVGTFLLQTNLAYLPASRSGGYPRPFTRPLYSTNGTRDGYNARFVPYFNSSDHMCFVEGAVGVPAVATINWDDPYIHSSDDDLYQIDQTQLLRNQFLMGATGFVLAYAERDDLPLFLSEIYAQGLRRLGSDMEAAVRSLNEPEEGSDGWADAELLVEQGILREARALRSAKFLAGGDGEGNPQIRGYVERLKAHEGSLRSDIAAMYLSLHGSAPSPPDPDSLALAAMKKVPVNVTPLDTYFTARGAARFRGNLHGLMRDEVYNFVDGKRNYLEIFKAVRAEQLAGGSWYYGTVTLKDVAGQLDAAVESGALRLQ